MGKSIVATVCALALCGAAQADTFQPSHPCSQPYKPFEFTSDWELRNFLDEVEDYRQCIEDFVEEQQDAIRKHSAAAEEAIEEWNDYVDSELN